MGLAHPTHVGTRGPIQTPSAKELHLAEFRRRAFCAMAHALWNIMLQKVRAAPLFWPSGYVLKRGYANRHLVLKEKLLAGVAGAVTEKAPPLLCSKPIVF